MPTCSNCKKRKVKCDGQTPTCGPCASRRHSTTPCDYTATRQPHSPSDLLPRGDACIPCRRKKKKCNGERPVCRTCIIAKKAEGCVYNDNSTPSLLTTLVERNRELERLLGAVCWPIPAGGQQQQQQQQQHQQQQHQQQQHQHQEHQHQQPQQHQQQQWMDSFPMEMNSVQAASSMHDGLWVSSASTMSSPHIFDGAMLQDAPMVMSDHPITMPGTPAGTIPGTPGMTVSAAHSMTMPNTPSMTVSEPPLHMQSTSAQDPSVPLVGPSTKSESDPGLQTGNSPTPSTPTLVNTSPSHSIPVSPSLLSKPPPVIDDYRELRRLFLENGVVLGQSATREKWHAVYIGDTSWTTVHPALIHIAQLFGARIYNGLRPHMPPLDEESHLNVALMLLSMPPMTVADAITHIQCCCLLSVHYMKVPDIATAREWILKADTIARQFDLHITPQVEGHGLNARGYLPDDCPYRLLVATDEEDEKRDVLCQLLYIDSVLSLRMRLPPLLSPQLRQEFDTLLLHYLTRMKEASMTVIRMASIALLHEARMVMTEGSSPGSPAISSTSGVPTPFAATIRRIHLYLADLNELVLAIPPTPSDRPRYLMLQQCTLVPATALASIYHLLTPTHPELQRKCVDAVAEIVGISDALTPDDCSQLDPVISVCWSVALNITMQIQQQIVERNLRDPGYYSGIQLGQLPTFIDVLRTCAQKVRWPFPLVGGISLSI